MRPLESKHLGPFFADLILAPEEIDVDVIHDDTHASEVKMPSSDAYAHAGETLPVFSHVLD